MLPTFSEANPGAQEETRSMRRTERILFGFTIVSLFSIKAGIRTELLKEDMAPWLCRGIVPRALPPGSHRRRHVWTLLVLIRDLNVDNVLLDSASTES